MLLQREHGKVMQDLQMHAIQEEGRSQADFLSTCQATLYASPAETKGVLVSSCHILLGQAPISHLFALLQRTSPMKRQSTPIAPPMPAPKQSSRPKRQHPSPDHVDSMSLGRTTSKTMSERPPSSKWQEIPS